MHILEEMQLLHEKIRAAKVDSVVRRLMLLMKLLKVDILPLLCGHVSKPFFNANAFVPGPTANLASNQCQFSFSGVWPACGCPSLFSHHPSCVDPYFYLFSANSLLLPFLHYVMGMAAGIGKERIGLPI